MTHTRYHAKVYAVLQRSITIGCFVRGNVLLALLSWRRDHPRFVFLLCGIGPWLITGIHAAWLQTEAGISVLQFSRECESDPGEHGRALLSIGDDGVCLAYVWLWRNW